jgi:DNA polymerase alpha-associated DNA helicase A
VLVCGASNLSVDNLLLRLSPIFAPTQITRIGHPARILPALLPSTLDYQTAHSSSGEIVKDVKAELEGHLNTLTKGRKEKGAVKGKKRGEVYGEVRELRKEFRKREGKVVRDVLSTTQVRRISLDNRLCASTDSPATSQQIVLATCHTAGSRQLLREDFDVVLIDEATQALEAVCLIPILKARKLILAGDPCQLGPTVLSSKPSASRSAAKPSATSRSKKEKPSPRDDRPASTDAEPLPVDGSEQLLAPEDPSATIDDEEEGADASAALAPDEQLAASAALSAPARADTLAPLRNLRPLRSLETTLFGRLERLYGPGVKRILTVQYRSGRPHSQSICVPFADARLLTAQDERLDRRLPVQGTIHIDAQIGDVGSYTHARDAA